MKYLKIILLAGVVSVPFAAGAMAADNNAYVPPDASTMSGLYLRGDVGANYLAWASPDNVFAWDGGGGIGYQFDQNWRADITGNWTGNYNLTPGTLRTTEVLGNLYYDWKNDSAITPYVGVGVGYGWASYAGATQPSANGIALGVNAGVSMDMTSNLALDVGYHFRDIMDGGVNPVEHGVTAGLRVKF